MPGTRPAHPKERYWSTGHAVAIAALVLALCAGIALKSPLNLLDRLFLDAALHLLAPERSAEPVVLVAIDDASLAEVGRWPWPRSVQAELVARLDGAAAIAFNVAPVEPARDQAMDRRLRAALRRHGRVVLPIIAVRSGAGVTEVPPLPALAEAAAGLGHVMLPNDADGFARRLVLWAGTTEPLMPSLAIEALAVAGEWRLGDAPRAEGMRDGLLFARPRLVPFGRLAPVAEVAAADVLAGRVDPALWRERVVVVGVIAEGVADMFPVRRGSGVEELSGAELQAQSVQALATGATARAAPVSLAVPAALAGAGITAVLFVAGARCRMLLTVGVPAPILASCALLVVGDLWISPSGPVFVGLALATLREAGRRRRHERTIARQREQVATMLQTVETGMLLVDDQGRVQFANAAAERLTGRSGDGLVGRPLAGFLVEDRTSPLRGAAAAAALEGFAGCAAEAELAEVQTPGGERRVAMLSRAPMRPPPGEHGTELVAMTDVTELIHAKHELERLATYDLTTGLPNRQFVNRHLAFAIARTLRGGSDLAVLVLDLDHFKEVNDKYGHQTGDALLTKVAERLLAVCRQSDIVARLGGDEFIVIVEDLGERRHAALLADKMLAAFAEPVDVGGRRLYVELSIGISCLSDQPGDAEALLGRADRAMYAAKHRRGAFRFFSADLDAAARHELELRDELRHSLVDRRFELHFQPLVEIADGRIIGFEALLRWRRPNGDAVPPTVFVPVAENAGLIEPITEWIIEEALRTLETWRRQSRRALTVSINVSARHFLDPRLVRTIEGSLAAAGLPPSAVTIELTESMLMRDPAKVIDVMRTLKSREINLAIDDFGTGYSSLAYLRDFPIDELKIDRSFTAAIGRDERDDLIVTAIARLAQSLRLAAVAEGVESPQQVAFLRRVGVRHAQGFLFSRPLPLADATRIIAARRPLDQR